MIMVVDKKKIILLSSVAFDVSLLIFEASSVQRHTFDFLPLDNQLAKVLRSPILAFITVSDCLILVEIETPAVAHPGLFFFSSCLNFSASVFPSQCVCAAIHIFIFNITHLPALLTCTRSTQMAAVENDVTISLATLWAGVCVCVWRKARVGGCWGESWEKWVAEERKGKAGLFIGTLAPIHNLSCSPSLLLR